jgi:hypothetical protein
MAEYKRWVKWMLFFSSYVPLWASMMFDTFGMKYNIYGFPVPIFSIFFAIVMLVSSFVLYLSIEIRKSKEPKYRTVSDYRRRDELLSSYLVAYIIPFVSLNYSSFSDWIILIIFLSVLASIQIKSDQLYVNPLLAAMGYRIYEMEYDDYETSLVVVDKDVQVQRGPLKMTEISPGIYLSTD